MIDTMLDYHLHLWEHGPRPLEVTIEQVAAYCERAEAAGVVEIAITEHLHRFAQTQAVFDRWWEDERVASTPALRAAMADFYCGEGAYDLDRYVEVVLAAKAEGLPVVLGLEVDHHRGRMEEVAGLLDGYPFDVLLGSVHWIGTWGFDNLADGAFAREWETRAIEDVWDAYTTDLEELAETGVCDVLAHPDLCKITGRRPAVPDEFHDRMAEAAKRAGMAAEVSSAGWRKPVDEAYPGPALLRSFRAADVPVTTASDAHRLETVAERRDDIRALLADAGYEHLQAYRERAPRAVAIA
jgi:histidinol-phosphatase (PHP family)